MTASVQTLPALLAETYERFGDRVAIRSQAGDLTFDELRRAAAGAAGSFHEAGAAPGDRVMLALWGGVESRVLELAILGHGFVRVAVSPRLHAREVAAIAVDCDAALIYCEPDALLQIGQALIEAGSAAVAVDARAAVGARTDAPLHSARAEDTAMVIYSSGTSGTPKGAVVTHAGWVAQSARALSQLPPVGSDDLVLAVAQLPHLGGSIALNYATAGAATLFIERFEPTIVIAAIEKWRVTAVPLATTMLERLTAELIVTGRRLPSLRAVPYGGSGIRQSSLRRAVEALPGVLVQFYGLAEALAPLAVLSSADHDAGRALDSAGRWLPDVECETRDGVLSVRGEVVTPCYLDGAGIDDNGWFVTGDLAELVDGYLFIRGRADDSIDTGGLKVRPLEIESVIAEIPGVADVAVIGIPSAVWGEAVTAVIQLDGTSSSVSLAVLQEACQRSLARYKKPVAMEVVAQIPRTAAGKPDRARLRRELGPLKGEQ